MRIVAALALAFMAVLALAAPASASDKVGYAAVPAWVKPADIPERAPAKGGSYQLLLDDRQVRFVGDEDHHYSDTAYRVLTAQGLSDLGTLRTRWDPVIQTLVIHRAQIVRKGEVIDLLAGGEPFSILRREERLDQAQLDGELTALKEVKGLRVGDIVRFTTTTIHKRSIAGAQPEAWTTLGHAGVAAHVRYRAVWPKALNVQVKTTEGFAEARRSDLGDEVEVISEMFDVETPEPPDGAPVRFNTLAEMEVSGFSDWPEVSRMMAPLYAKASAMKTDSPLKAEVAKIRAEHATPEAQALAALRLVQTEVRYLALLMGQGGLDPAPADETWNTRFGDCKGKTALLLSLLDELGIEAVAAAVDTKGGDAAPLRLPRIGVFDHVIVRASIGGKIYWLDGTRTGDRNLEELTQGYFGWALPVSVAGSDLEKMELKPAEAPLLALELDLDARAGFDKDVEMKIGILLRGEYGQAMEQMMALGGIEAAKDAVKEGYAADYGGTMEVRDIQIAYDEAAAGYRATIDLKGPMEWERVQGLRAMNLMPGYEYELSKRPANQDQTAPYALSYPDHTVVRIHVRYREEDARSLNVIGGDQNMTAGGVAIRRTITRTAGETIAETSVRTLVPEVEAKTIESAARAFAQARADQGAVLVWSGPGRVNAREQALADRWSRARELYLNGDYAAATVIAEEMLKADSRHPGALLVRAEQKLRERSYPAALRDARRLVSVTGSTPSSMVVLYNALIGMKDYRELLKVADRQLRNQPEDIFALRMRGAALAGLNRPADMLAAYETLYDAVGAKQADFGLASLRQVVSAQTREQLEEIDRVLVANPQSPSARVLRGWFQGQKDPRLAPPQYDQALLLAPDFQFARRQRMAANITQKNYPSALSDLEVMLGEDRSTQLLRMRGDVYAQLDEAEKALKDYDEAIGLDPGNAVLLNQRCWLRARMDIEPQKAIADCNEAIRLRPTYAPAYDSRGLAYLRLGKAAEAIADYDSSLASRDSAHSLFGRALARSVMNDKAAAEADRAKAVALDPKVADTYAGYGLKP